MRAVVTGAAGFIGSTLAEALVRDGHSVLGIDCFTDYYPAERKRENIAGLITHPSFALEQLDLVRDDMAAAFSGADAVFHLAGQPGVRSSWANGFGSYATGNVLATQRVLEAAARERTPRVVYSSSSSVYGSALRFPCREDDLPRPLSPYGVTKLAGEHLARLYADNHGLSTVSLRYFTVFGPRQRPEMAMSQIIEAGLREEPFRCFAAPGAVRDFTFVDDVVRATVLAGLTVDVPPGSVLNVAGGAPCSMREVTDMVGELLGREVQVDRSAPQAGDVVRTGGATERIRDLLGWRAEVGLREGLARQVDWHVRRRAGTASPTTPPPLPALSVPAAREAPRRRELLAGWGSRLAAAGQRPSRGPGRLRASLLAPMLGAGPGDRAFPAD